MPPELISHAEPTFLTREIVVRQFVHVGHPSTKRCGEACVDRVKRLLQSARGMLEKVGHVLHAERMQLGRVIKVKLLEARVSVQVHRRSDHDRPTLVFQKSEFGVGVGHHDGIVAKDAAHGGYVFWLSACEATIRKQHQRAKVATLNQKPHVVSVAYTCGPSGNNEVTRANLCHHSLDQVEKAELAFGEAHDSTPGRQLSKRTLCAFCRREYGTRGRGIKTNGRRGVAKKSLLVFFRCHAGNIPRNAGYSQ